MDDQRRLKTSKLPTVISVKLARLAAIGVFGLVLAVGGVIVDSAASASQTSGTRLVPGYLNQLPLATVLGAVSPTHAMRIGVGIERPNTAGELALYKEMYNPKSSEYHHFLTPAEFNARFGVKPATTAAVRSWLTAGGLTINTVSGGDYITATGTVAQLDKLFKVTINSYVYKGEHFIANNKPASVPTSLPIDGLLGLDSVHRFSLAALHGHQLLSTVHSKRAELAMARAIHTLGAKKVLEDIHSGKNVTGVTGALVPDTQPGVELDFTPQELWGVYDDPGAAAVTNATTGESTPSQLESSTATLGQGQTLGIFGEGETSSVVQQLRLFEVAMGLPKIPVRTFDTEGTPDSGYGDNSGAVEWYLDSQSSTGMSPDASQLSFYFAKTLFDADIAQDFTYWVNDTHGPKQINASFGECEANPTNPVTGPLAQQPYGTELGDELEETAEPLLRQATMEGRTLFTSAGDTGSGCPEIVVPVAGAANGLADQPVPAVEYPCASDYAVCVGGTVVSANGATYPTGANKRTDETSWSFGGGGQSEYIPAPSFQNGVANVTGDCVANTVGDPDTPLSTLCRGVPDVSDLSGNSLGGDGYFIYIDGEPSSEGGTSLASPLMMGQWARVQAAEPTATQSAGGTGFANPIIYAQAASADKCATAPCTGAYAKEFYDVTESEDMTGNGEYRPGAGWDYASGWGALDVANFTQAVDGTTTASDTAAAAECTAINETTASLTSPVGNATNPVVVSLGNEPSLDLTGATLSATPTTVTATLTGPALGSAPPAAAATGNLFYVAWEYKGEVYYAEASQSGSQTFTYSSGNTGTYGTASTYGYNNTASSKATGSFDASTDTLTISVPASEVGSPPAGALLTTPQAFDQLTADLSFTTDSSDELISPLTDYGVSNSVGESVVVGGVAAAPANPACKPAAVPEAPATTTTPTTPTTPTKTSTGKTKKVVCTGPHAPVEHIKSKQLSGTSIRLGGVAHTRNCGKLKSIGVSIAKVVGHQCRYLQTNGRFGKLVACVPKVYLTAKGLKKWTFTRKVNLSKGVYRLWARAVDTNGPAEPKSSKKYVFLRVR